MADGYIDLSSITHSIDNAMDGLGRQIGTIRQEVESLASDVDSRMSVMKSDLEHLKKSFEYMMKENHRQAVLQRALTEIIRVRQELERDYGNYKQVRNTMLGILEATDIQLVRETTIASCTEELMLSTPRYWLAPVLIALSAWIADNKPLATRALAEALRRDEEKTCLTFALICRRNRRTKACFEWLSRYFARQKANDMKESIIAYIDAYTNGIFGEDKDNLCEEYIQNWMQELQQSNANFEDKQKTYWKGFYQTYCKDTTQQYYKLAECAKTEFGRMNDYVMRINAAPEIIGFFAKILGAEVDQKSLITAIDNELVKLIKNYDTEEAPLREEEEYLTDIKNFNGDEARANTLRALRKANRADRKVDLAERLSETIVSNRQEDISAKKTAIRFMQGYISGAFKEFIEEKAPYYPNEITVTTHEWSGKTKDGSNKKDLDSSYESFVSDRRKTELSTVKNVGMIACWVIAMLCVIVAIVGFAVDGMIWLAVLGLIAAVGVGIGALVLMNKNKKKRLSINGYYDTMLNEGKNDIDLTVTQLMSINKIAFNFNAVASCKKLLLTEGN